MTFVFPIWRQLGWDKWWNINDWGGGAGVKIETEFIFQWEFMYFFPGEEPLQFSLSFSSCPPLDH